MTDITPGSIYDHRKTGNLYKVIDVVPIKWFGIWWSPGVVVYKSYENGHSYARFHRNFLKAFRLVLM